MLTVPTGVSRRFRTIRALCLVYLAATVATLGFLVWKRDDHSLVTTDTWVHEVILLVFAVVLVGVAKRTAAGDPRAYLRLRIVSLVIAVVSVVVAVLPGLFPAWMRIEQGAYAACLLAVAALAHTPAVRTAVATMA